MIYIFSCLTLEKVYSTVHIVIDMELFLNSHLILELLFLYRKIKSLLLMVSLFSYIIMKFLCKML